MGISILSSITSDTFQATLNKAGKGYEIAVTTHDGPSQFQHALQTVLPDIVFFETANSQIETIVSECLNSPAALEDQPLFILVQSETATLSDFWLEHLDGKVDLTADTKQFKLIFNMCQRIKALKEAYLLTLDLADFSQKKLSEAEETWIQARAELESIAHHDALTGLYNRKYMETGLKEAITSARQNSFFLSLVMLDIDHFKSINDGYGHQVGDEVLKRVSAELQAGMRKSDIAARYGGEEMIGILIGTSSKDALLVTEKIRQKIADIHFLAVPIQKKGDETHYMLVEIDANLNIKCLLFPQTDADANAAVESQWAEDIWLAKIKDEIRAISMGQPPEPALPMTRISITASFGISTYPDDFTISSKGSALLESTSEEDLMIYMADKALYKAKKSGRNRTLNYYGIQCALDETVPIHKTAEQLMIRLKAKDYITYLHSLRVGLMASHLARAVGLSDSEQEVAKWSGILHDVGKTKIPSSILLKPGRLTDEEFTVMKTHPDEGVAMANEFRNLAACVPGIQLHHERWNGKGYPQQLCATDIPMVARILGIVDTFDAMTSSRPYRLKTDHDIADAQAEISRNAGILYDSALVAAFEPLIPTFSQFGDLNEKDLRLALNFPF